MTNVFASIDSLSTLSSGNPTPRELMSWFRILSASSLNEHVAKDLRSLAESTRDTPQARDCMVSLVAGGGWRGSEAAKALRTVLDDNTTAESHREAMGAAAFSWWMKAGSSQIATAPVFLLRLAHGQALRECRNQSAQDLEAAVRGKFPDWAIESDDVLLACDRPILQDEMGQAAAVLQHRGVAVGEGSGSCAAPIVVYAYDSHGLKHQLSRELDKLTEVRPLVINLSGHYVGGFARPGQGGSVSVSLLDTQPDPGYVRQVRSAIEVLCYKASILEVVLQGAHPHLAQACGALAMLMLECCMAQPRWQDFAEEQLLEFSKHFTGLSPEVQASRVNNMRSDLLQRYAEAHQALLSAPVGATKPSSSPTVEMVRTHRRRSQANAPQPVRIQKVPSNPSDQDMKSRIRKTFDLDGDFARVKPVRRDLDKVIKGLKGG